MSAARTLPSWRDLTAVRIADIRAVHCGTTQAPDLLRDLLATLSDELRLALDDAPCPERRPVAWATWREEVVSLHACRRSVRQHLRWAEAAVRINATPVVRLAA